GELIEVSSVLSESVAWALETARLTGGLVDPTVGTAIAALGYDRDFDEVDLDGPELSYAPVPAPGWRLVELDRRRRLLRVPPGVSVDLGSSAKAFAADRAAKSISAALRTGVLVNLGGDVSVAGEVPPGGWRVGIALDAATPPEETEHVVSISSGGIASSGTAARSWRRGDRVLHHLIDPRTGDVADSLWALISVAATSAALANAASTAAMVIGSGAPAWLEARGLPARLVYPDGSVALTCGWPADRTGGEA
ncbi:MAG: FAD:protein transferase, partial [Acidimicrobiaceae bacterium]|nr:FAD:protein transferase [Acidimicrobiaceae bacterium]